MGQCQCTKEVPEVVPYGDLLDKSDGYHPSIKELDSAAVNRRRRKTPTTKRRRMVLRSTSTSGKNRRRKERAGAGEKIEETVVGSERSDLRDCGSKHVTT